MTRLASQEACKRSLYRLALAACAASIVGCATVAASNDALPIDETGKRSDNRHTKSGLLVTGEELDVLASRYFGAIRITFENPSSRWVNVRTMRIGFGSEELNKGVLLPWGSQVDSWMQATLRRNAVRQANVDAALTVVALAGTATRAAAGDSTAGDIGAVAAGGAVAISAIDGLNTQARLANSPPLFPDSHLLAVPFAIPPGLFADKWVLLQTSDPSRPACHRAIVLDYETDVGGRERVVLPFRTPGEPSEWQSGACHPSRKSK